MELNWNRYRPAADATIITTLDLHVAGEPFRIITGGLPELQGATMLERRRYMRQHFDHIRRALIWEPRGHFDMYGCVLTPAVSPEADLGVLFMHNEGYSTMCGHGAIALATALLETGILEAKGRETPVDFDTPAGLVRATVHLDNEGHAEHVSFLNVPSFLYARDLKVELPHYGQTSIDVAFGGAFYAIVPAEQVGLKVEPGQIERLVAAGEAITQAVNTTLAIQHPIEEDLGFLYGTILTGPPEDPTHHSRNLCIFGNAEADRSPTGTGVSARLALLHAKGEIGEDQEIAIESILGKASVFGGRIVGRAKVGQYDAVIPEVSGRAFITGRHEFIIDPRDKLGQGFLIV